MIKEMTFTLDFGAIATTVVTTAILALAALVAKSNRILNQIVLQIGTNYPPEGMLGRISKLELELFSLRDWAITQGYERRQEHIPSK